MTDITAGACTLEQPRLFYVRIRNSTRIRSESKWRKEGNDNGRG